jgi:hypothetical protein
MKYRWMIVAAMLYGMTVAGAYAQQRDTVRGGDEEESSFDKKLGSDIEDFIRHITDQWEHGWSEPKYSETSTEDIQAGENLSDSNAVVFRGDTVIHAGDTVHTSIVVLNGNLSIGGCVEGNATVRRGSLLVKKDGRVRGNVLVVNGTIVKEEGGIIEGYEERKGLRPNRWRPSKEQMEKGKRTFDVPWAEEQTSIDRFMFRYNRVEGFFLGLGAEKKYYWDGFKDWNAYGFGGWGVKSHTWRGELGLARQFSFSDETSEKIFELGMEGYNLTDTKDGWIISTNENTAAALLIHEDFRNYFQREGYALHAAYYAKSETMKEEVSIAYRIDNYESLRKNVDWALFGGGQWFRENPAIDPGSMHSVLLTAGLSTVVKEKRNSEGWDVFGSAEYAKKDFGGDFDFDRYLIDIRRFQPLGGYDCFNVRFRAGSSAGTLPVQKDFELGGFGTMNAFPFKSDTGNRMILMNAEYIFDGRMLDDIDFLGSWFFRMFNFILFSDAGFTRTSLSSASAADGFGSITWKEFQQDFGVAVGDRNGSFRAGVAWRTDIKSKAEFILRFNRPF